MPTYVYGCKNHPEARQTVIHGMKEIVAVQCPVCAGQMHRIPQRFLWGHNPGTLLLDKLSERFDDYRSNVRYGTKRRYQRGTPI